MYTLPEVAIYSDGACFKNPGPGGYGVVLISDKGKRKELSGGFRHTTNNRMEILSAIMGLRTLKVKCRVTVYTDSRLLVDSIMKGWAKRWRKNNWMRNKDEKALNADLWEEMLTLIDKHEVTFKWIKGHAGHVENEHCDKLSKEAARGKKLPIDTGYENGNNHMPH
ncbi:MAG: ribonuclease HI [Candidatus Magnetoovum sp. WYHC-5]|nr:ribonuclease HI [Candidatus Magnetoovum sp. WYHC-5]